MPQAQPICPDTPTAQRSATGQQLPQAESPAAFGLLVSRQFAQCRREGGQLGVLWVDIEVQAPHDAGLGEAARAALVQMVGQRLRNRVRGSDEVVRVGEQGFAVLLLAAGAAETHIVERRLLLALSGSYGVDGRLMQVGLRVGSAVFPQAGRNGVELLEAARANLAD